MNYKIQLNGTTRTQIVHHNLLKLCHGDPEKCKSRGLEQTNEEEVVPTTLHSSLGVVLDQGVERFGGYVCADDIMPEQPVHHRPQWDRHPPLRYGHYYTHYKILQYIQAVKEGVMWPMEPMHAIVHRVSCILIGGVVHVYIAGCGATVGGPLEYDCLIR